MAGKGTKPKGPGAIAKLYLMLYNLVQTIGWSFLLHQIINYYISPPSEKTLWDTVKVTVYIFQNAALLEVVHSAIRIVSANPFLTFAQVLSRVMVVCGVLLVTPQEYVHSSIGLPMALLAWSITEIIRYFYYFLNLIGYVPYIHVWLRYSTFIVLYPFGVTGELLCIYAAQRYSSAHPDVLSYALPNSWNFTFSYNYLLIITMLMYIPFFPQLYCHMFAQRRKLLGPAVAKKTHEIPEKTTPTHELATISGTCENSCDSQEHEKHV